MSSFEPLRDWQRKGDFSRDGSHASTFRHEREPAQDAAIAVGASVGESLEERLQRAREEGLAAGRAERDEGARELETLEAAAREILELRDGYLAAHRREVVELALAIAGTIVGRPLADDADALSARLEQALTSMEPSGPLKLRLSPSEHALVASGDDSDLARGVAGASIETCADPDLAPGEFRLEAGPAETDGRRATLLADLRQRLIEAIEGEGS